MGAGTGQEEDEEAMGDPEQALSQGGAALRQEQRLMGPDVCPGTAAGACHRPTFGERT